MARNSRKRSGVLPFLTAAASFAVVLSALYFLSQPVQSEAVAAEAPQAASQPQPDVVIPNTIRDEAVFVIDDAVETPARVASVRAESADADTVLAYLAAGEFGSALDLAGTIADQKERVRLYHQIVKAQVDAGEFQGALMSLQQVATRNGFAEESESSSSGDDLAGGADFTELIELIETNTTGPWLDVDGVGGTMTEFNSGVLADPNGLLQRLARVDVDGRLESLGLKVREADLNADMAQQSDLRFVSLTRIERAVSDRIDAGLPVTEAMKNLAGINQVQYLVVLPETQEIVIGGPAEAWQFDENNLAVGIDSGRPVLQLDDLVTLLRTFSDSGSQQFECSIDPTESGVRRLHEYIEKSNQRGSIDLRRVDSWARSLQRMLGMQDVRVDGVPADSRVARVIVEADYRMKLIGIDKLDAVAGIDSIFDLLPKSAQQNPPAIDGLRWWMTMKYDSVLHSPDRDVFEIAGASVRCLSENELVTAQGKRVQTGQAEDTNRQFAANFTDHYAELAAHDNVFADLQNVFDLALAAALIQREGLDDATNWTRGVFAGFGAYEPTRYEPIHEVNSVVNHRIYNGRDIVVQVAGGVDGNVVAELDRPGMLKSSERLESVAPAAAPVSGRWWWDSVK